MIDYKEFVSKEKSLLIAPAGYGKTHTIAECLKYIDGTQLILTHTHAGVASLKEKIKKIGIQTSRYKVETITSFAQKYVQSFYCGNDIPEQDNKKEYFPFIIKKATDLMRLKPIKEIVRNTYAGIFVDEYQDCTISQHQFLLTLAEIVPTHILGDPLQGIFDFNKERLVDWDVDIDDFKENTFELSEAWRWKNTNPQLGICLSEIREELINGNEIDLKYYKDVIDIIEIHDKDIYNPQKNYYIKICDILKTEDSLLLLHPNSKNLDVRKKIVQQFRNRFYLIEAIDSKDFYKLARQFDNAKTDNIFQIIRDTCSIIFNKSELNNWFNQNGVKNKRYKKDKMIIAPIKDYIDELGEKISFVKISKVLKEIKKLPKIKCYRKELFTDLCKALEQAEYHNESIYESMKNIRNKKRRVGRKIKGKCIGTTLLTKGLEFDTVVILNAHNFNCPKHLYVALTRASKKLVIFTETMILKPYKKN